MQKLDLNVWLKSKCIFPKGKSWIHSNQCSVNQELSSPQNLKGFNFYYFFYLLLTLIVNAVFKMNSKMQRV